MARGVNKVILIGNLGIDPEVRYMPSGDAVTNVRIATTDTWRDKTSGENREQTEWHNVVFFGRLAEIAGQYLRKGSKVYIEGSLRTRKWQDKEGQERYTTEIRVQDMQMLDSRNAGGSAELESTSPSPPRRSSAAAAKPAPAGTQGSPTRGNQQSFDDEFDDDIPF